VNSARFAPKVVEVRIALELLQTFLLVPKNVQIAYSGKVLIIISKNFQRAIFFKKLNNTAQKNSFKNEVLAFFERHPRWG